MTKIEMIRIAKIAIRKNWDFEQLKYCDYMYGKEHLADDVWEFVEEHDQIGAIAFDEKYKDAQ